LGVFFVFLLITSIFSWLFSCLLFQRLAMVHWSKDLVEPGHSQPISSFPPFVKFPPELRDAIWSEACQLRREIFVYGRPIYNDQQNRNQAQDQSNAHSGIATECNESTEAHSFGVNAKPTTFQLYTLFPCPAVLHTCRESRAVGLRFYDRGFFLGGPRKFGPRIYVNRNWDCIWPRALDEWPYLGVSDLFSCVAEGFELTMDVAASQYFSFSLASAHTQRG
jgi:2EXR family